MNCYLNQNYVKMENNKLDILQGENPIKDTATGVNTQDILSTSQIRNERFYCDAIKDDGINDVIKSVVPHVVTFIGFSEFGKSTFVASMYHQAMATGKIGDYDFFDSDTFSGFERRAYIRNAKLNPKKRFARTSNNDGYFLTMEFLKGDKVYKLAISDRSGEMYMKEYTASLKLVEADKSLINSHHIIFFIDASIFVSDDFLEFESKFNLLLSRMCKAKVFDTQKTIDIIFNKKDLVNDNNEFDLQVNNLKHKIEEETKIKINKEFRTRSDKMAGNRELLEVFEYIVSCCNLSDPSYGSNVDWVTTLLNK